MNIGFGKTRIILYAVAGIAMGILIIVTHELLEAMGVAYHNFLISFFIPVLVVAMILLARRENALFSWGSSLDDARNRVNQLMLMVTAKKRWSLSLEEDTLPTCWRQLGCDKEDCPVFGMEHARCWLIAGTFCRGRVQGKFARKLEDCHLCDVYREATAEPVKEITENFYIMSHLLSEREEELEKAYASSQARSEKLAGLVTLSEAAVSSIHLGELLQNLLESVASFAGADLGLVSLPDRAGEKLVVRTACGLEKDAAKALTTRMGEGVIGQAFATNRIVVAEDISSDARIADPYLQEQGVKTLICIPLRGLERPLGMLTLATLVSHHFTEEEKDTLCIAADRIAATVENAQLVSELDRDREQVELITELAEDIDARGGIVSVYTSFVKLAEKILDFDRASLAIWHPESEEFEIVAMETNAPRTWLASGLRLPKHALPFGKVIDERRCCLRREITGKDYPADKLLVEEGIRSSAIFPLISKGEVLGTLNLGSRKQDAFSEEDADMLKPLIKQLGVVLDSARLLQEARSGSLRDGPSGLYNHRFLYEATVREVARGERYQRPVSILILDAEGFNRWRGSRTGSGDDNGIRMISRQLKAAVRSIDVVARYSAVEFAVLMPETEADGGGDDMDGKQLARRIRDSLGEALAAEADVSPAIDIRIGMAEYPSHAVDAASLLEKAEGALRQARLGEDKVVIATGAAPA